MRLLVNRIDDKNDYELTESFFRVFSKNRNLGNLYCSFDLPAKLALLSKLKEVKPLPDRKINFQHLITCFRSFEILTKTQRNSRTRRIQRSLIQVIEKSGHTWVLHTLKDSRHRSTRHQGNRHQEVYSPPQNNSAIIGTVYVPRTVTSSSSPNTSFSMVIDTLRQTPNI